MTDKPEYYEALGVSREASADEIKRAFQKVVMRNHPDVIKNKTGLTDAQKEEAARKFRDAKEAHDVLSDPVKRETYNRYGHKGVENLGRGNSSGASQSGVSKPTPRKTYSAEDAINFFTERAERSGAAQTSGAGRTGADLDDAAEMRRRRREARRGNGAASSEGGMAETPAAEAPSMTVTEKFRETAREADRMSQKIQDAAVPVEVLEKFRENLRDFMGELDKAIAKARKQPGGPGF